MVKVSKLNRSETSLDLVQRFWNSPGDSLWDQKQLSIILGFSEKWFERFRWVGGGISFLKIGSRVRYRKSSVTEFLNQQSTLNSTSQSLTEDKTNADI